MASSKKRLNKKLKEFNKKLKELDKEVDNKKIDEELKVLQEESIEALKVYKEEVDKKSKALDEKLEAFDEILDKKLKAFDEKVKPFSKRIKLKNKHISTERFKLYYNKGGIYNQFKIDLLKYVKKHQRDRVARGESSLKEMFFYTFTYSDFDDFIVYEYKELDDLFVKCVQDIILSEKYINHIDIIKSNLEIDLDMDNNFNGDYNTMGLVSVLITIAVFLLSELVGGKIFFAASMILATISISSKGYERKSISKRRYFFRRCILESIKIIENKMYVDEKVNQ